MLETNFYLNIFTNRTSSFNFKYSNSPNRPTYLYEYVLYRTFEETIEKYINNLLGIRGVTFWNEIGKIKKKEKIECVYNMVFKKLRGKYQSFHFSSYFVFSKREFEIVLTFYAMEKKSYKHIKILFACKLNVECIF